MLQVELTFDDPEATIFSAKLKILEGQVCE
eukprot:SAG31_NODE_3809_length_3863_cov_2.881775_3_plen_30_part_00